MGITIGDLTYWIRGNSSKLPADLKQSENQVTSFGQRVSASLKEQMNFAAGQMMSQGLTQISTGLKSFVTDVVDSSQKYTEEINNLHIATGSSLEDSSRLYNVADDLNVEYGDLYTSLKLYAKSLQDSGSTEKLTTETLAKLSEEYLKLPEGVARTNFALDHFGKSGDTMMKILEAGPDKIRAMSAAVDENAIVSEKSAKAAADYSSAMNDWNDALRDVKNELADALKPELTEFLRLGLTLLIPMLRMLVDAFKIMPEPIKWAVIAFGGLLIVLGQLAPSLLGIAGLVSMLGGASGLAGIGTAISGVAGPALAALGGVVGAISLPVLALIAAIALLGVTIVTLGPQAWSTVKMIGGIISAYAQQMTSNVRAWWRNVGSGIMAGIGDGISAGWQYLINLVSQVAQSLLTAARNALNMHSPSKPFVAIGEGIDDSAALGVQNRASNLQKVVKNTMGTLTSSASGARGSRNVTVQKIEYHGSFSESEYARLDKRAGNIAGNTLMEALGGI